MLALTSNLDKACLNQKTRTKQQPESPSQEHKNANLLYYMYHFKGHPIHHRHWHSFTIFSVIDINVLIHFDYIMFRPCGEEYAQCQPATFQT